MNGDIDPSEFETIEQFCRYMEAHPEEASSIRYLLRRILGPDEDPVLALSNINPKIKRK